MSRDGLARTFRPTLASLEDRCTPANVGTANANFIDQLYRDVLHRATDPGAAGWVSQLNTGTDRGEVVDDILNSQEGRQNQVNDLYVRFLHRTADPGGLAYWTDFLGHNDHTNSDVAANIIGSNEYFQTRGGGTNQGFLNAVYEDVLCRPMSSNDVNHRNDNFDNGAEDRTDIAESILGSGEAEQMRDQHSVQSYLRQNASSQQAQNLVNDLDDNGGDFDNNDAVFSGTILSSGLYFNQAQTLTTTDFATIPSCDNVAAVPLGSVAPGSATTTTTGGTSGTSTTTTTATTM